MMHSTYVGVGGRGVFMGYKWRRMKKFLLWTLLVVQICLIFCLWCMQIGYTDQKINDKAKIATTQSKLIKTELNVDMLKKKASPLTIKGRVNFVTKAKISVQQKKELLNNKKLNFFNNVSNFTKDFAEVETYRLMNLTGIEAEMMEESDYGMEFGIMPSTKIWCFRHGTLNCSVDDNDAGGGLQIDWNADAQQLQCKCRQHWHGKDCGQNEVIYRALMLPPHNQFQLTDPLKTKKAHFLVYMLEGSFCSYDLLQLQIKSVVNVVDHFLIFWHINQQQPQWFKNSKDLKRKLTGLLAPVRLTLYECVSKISARADCTRNDAFVYFRKQLRAKFHKILQPTDLLLHTNENIILSEDALRFFKYYAPTSTPWLMSGWRFRLKYNVYGFFWQHPDKTYLSGYLSSLGHIWDDNWPVQLTNFLNTHEYNNNNNNGAVDSFRIIGDLNHYSGWYCQYCAHPDEIIEMLNQLEFPAAANILPPTANVNDFINLPKNSRNNLVIDTKYLEYLIAQGLHIDGKTRLLKNRMNSDAYAYYAPKYAEKLKWKFGNLLTNLFEAMENDYVLDEAEGGFGF